MGVQIKVIKYIDALKYNNIFMYFNVSRETIVLKVFHYITIWLLQLYFC